MMSQVKFYHHGRFAVAGGTLPDAVTAYQTFGDPKNPCIVATVCFGGRLDDKGPYGLMWLIGDGLPLDPSKYFIVTCALFGNGESSSPSNTPPPYDGPYFPRVTYEDNIRAQYNVLTKVLNVTKLFCTIGFSMGGQQSYYWASLYPDYVERFVCICGAARTSMHSVCMVESMKFAMKAAKDFQDGHYTSTPRLAKAAAMRILSSWGWGFEFYNEHQYLRGRTYTDLNDFLLAECEGAWAAWDANDQMTLFNTWQSGDISKTTRVDVLKQGDLASALEGIKAKALIMPSTGDMMFPVDDNQKEVQCMKNTSAKLAVIPSKWAHGACCGLNPPDTEFIMAQLYEFFDST